MNFEELQEYRAISEHWKELRCKATGVHYMVHIDEGLAIIDIAPVDDAEKEMLARAWCLHPFAQDGDDLTALSDNQEAIELATTYARVAGMYLSKDEFDATVIDGIYNELLACKYLRLLLMIDKGQNSNHFTSNMEAFGFDSIRRLSGYFFVWLELIRRACVECGDEDEEGADDSVSS